jgi:hypothetical protein
VCNPCLKHCPAVISSANTVILQTLQLFFVFKKAFSTNVLIFRAYFTKHRLILLTDYKMKIDQFTYDCKACRESIETEKLPPPPDLCGKREERKRINKKQCHTLMPHGYWLSLYLRKWRLIRHADVMKLFI